MAINIGRSIKKALADVEKTSAWLAKELNVSRAYASSIANSPYAPIKKVEAMARLFGMTTADFIALGEKQDT